MSARINIVSDGFMMIAEERMRQVVELEFDAMRDAVYTRCELRHAADCYARPRIFRPLDESAPRKWPWDLSHWKPSSDRKRELVKAGALYLAEASRLRFGGMIPTAERMERKAAACARKIDRILKSNTK